MTGCKITLDIKRLQVLYDHATAVDKPPKSEEEYRKQITKTLDEELFHSYIRRAFTEGKIFALKDALEKIS